MPIQMTALSLKTQLLRLAGLFGLFLVLNPLFALAATPPELYDEVWRIVNARFVDEDKNRQDWQIWRHRYDDKLKTPDDAYVAIESMVSSLNDRYTRFLNPEDFGEETRSIQAKLYGIGIQIGVRADRIVVIAPMEDTPAERAGLKAGDEITSINGQSTKGLSIKDGAKLIRGEKGTTVKIGVLRDGKPHNYSVVRDEIKLKSVSTETPFKIDIPKNIGYVKLSTFLSKTASGELKTVIENYKDRDALILDLRSNPGGLLSNAIYIADMFLKDGGIVSTVDRQSYKVTTYANPDLLSDQPLVVLIDGGSASASEILAGALKDHERAILVGKKSFGKGLVQEINPLSDGAGLNVTSQRYLTPNDTDINKKGITPDYVVDVTEKQIEAKQDPQLQKALDVISQDYKINLQPVATPTVPTVANPNAPVIPQHDGAPRPESATPMVPRKAD
jgi:carboxyl-terminal processing protease